MSQLVDDAKPAGVTVLAIAASVAAHILALAVPLALLQIYDRILPNQAYATTFVLAVGVTVAILLEALLRYGRAVLLAHVGAAFESRTTIQLLAHLLRSNPKAVQELGVPTLTDAVRAVGQVRDFWSGNAAAALHELPFAAIYIALIGYIASWLALIPLTLTLVALIAALVISRAAFRAVRAVDAAETSRRDLAWGIFAGLPEVKAMAAETMLTRRYRDVVARTMEGNARIENQMALIRENGTLLGQISTIAVVAAGAYMVVHGTLTTGGLAACTLLAGRSIGPVMGAFAYLSRLGYRDVAKRKIERVLSLPEAPLWLGHGENIFLGGTIDIAGPMIRNGPVSVPQGSIVHVDAADALTASALLESVARLDDSLGLEIKFDGEPSTAYDSVSLKRGIAMVTARTELLRGTLLDNLTLFSPQYNADAIRLSQRLGLSVFVDSLRQGLMTPMAPGVGISVSPGVAVRIGLVRALVRRPTILCLDEVGGALDLDGMRKLVELLRELKGRITIFLVSGNPALLQLADQKIRIEAGGAS
ncbi:MAG TPA: ABC transporter transmembrane domain-containing protein [Hypericibacter adhaerens]|uniref:Toxin ABC transporter n=1 Tax=Hypericibacter adhaerens TaxID=2602016 RepID=A0A5J6N306_9PROT|nr:ABC transporter transmembrane domain-containing protein [Hypericibacter adhaerens]QEX23375.1 toxin ABC transporter [Hypericibacter adhaerens]HWA45460.1 ABC transporter transmembrane domain-containing protein [Hypericibacter adhaerens]